MGLIFCGAVLVVGGVLSVVFGSYLNNNWQAQFLSLFNGYEQYDGGIWIAVGVGLILVGSILVTIGIIKLIQTQKRLDKYTGGRAVTSFQRNMILEYEQQMLNRVISQEEFEKKKTEILSE